MRLAILLAATLVLPMVAFAQAAPPTAPPPTAPPPAAAPPAAAPQPPPPPPPSEADYLQAQLQMLLETVQRLTPELVQARAQLSAANTHIKDLERKLADATKSPPATPADFDAHKPAAEAPKSAEPAKPNTP